MADGDYERRGARDAELTRFRRIIAEARQRHARDAASAESTSESKKGEQ